MLSKIFELIFGEKISKEDDEETQKILEHLLNKYEEEYNRFDEAVKEAAREMFDKYLELEKPEIVFEKISENATIPTYADDGSEGLDLYSPINFTIQPFSRASVPLDIKADIPKGFWLKIEARSGTSWKAGLETGAGVIDNSYKKNVGVVLHNLNNEPIHILKGDRIAQAIPMRCNRLTIKEGKVEDTTNRGGFGSSGR